jgi:Tfp pilus assembly protein PilF
MKRTVSCAIAAAAVLASAPAPAPAQDEAQFGKVHFQTSCNETAQRRFDRAMRYQHSFWYKPARELFEETLAADPDCAIAH